MAAAAGAEAENEGGSEEEENWQENLRARSALHRVSFGEHRRIRVEVGVIGLWVNRRPHRSATHGGAFLCYSLRIISLEEFAPR